MSDPPQEAKLIVEDILISHIRGNCTVEVGKIEAKIAASLAERDEEIANLKAEVKRIENLRQTYENYVADLRAELAEAQKERDDFKAALDSVSFPDRRW